MNQPNVAYVPTYYYVLPYYFSEGVIPIDVFLVQVSPPDRYGYMSAGVSADFIRQAVEAAHVVIVQVNSKVPWCASAGCLIHTDEVDHIVEYSEPLPCISSPPITDIDKKIGQYCAALVNDGDTIQIGIGNIPNAICSALMNKKNLGVHSEVISDGVMNLWKAGVVNNTKKGFDKGLMVACFAYGSQELYDQIDNNPAVSLQDAECTNDPRNIARCLNFISINTCIELDLMGRSVIAVTSTHTRKGKTISRIRPHLSKGSSVTVPRIDVDYVVTEYGIARLMGKNLKDRARALISIAHPDFRKNLIEHFEQRYKVKY